jgi:hypothetical protein
MIVNSTKEVIKMNMPGFTAEASHYKSNVSYRAFPSQGTTLTLSITPQRIPYGNPYGCYKCRGNCYRAYYHHDDLTLLGHCLDECPCEFF